MADRSAFRAYVHKGTRRLAQEGQVPEPAAEDIERRLDREFTGSKPTWRRALAATLFFLILSVVLLPLARTPRVRTFFLAFAGAGAARMLFWPLFSRRNTAFK